MRILRIETMNKPAKVFVNENTPISYAAYRLNYRYLCLDHIVSELRFG